MNRKEQVGALVDFAKQCYSRFTFEPYNSVYVDERGFSCEEVNQITAAIEVALNQSKILPAVDDWQKYLPIDVSQTAKFLREPVPYGYDLIRRLRVEKVCQCWKRQMKQVCRDSSILALPIKQGRRVRH